MEISRIRQKDQVEEMEQQMRKVLISYGLSPVKVAHLGQYQWEEQQRVMFWGQIQFDGLVGDWENPSDEIPPGVVTR